MSGLEDGNQPVGDEGSFGTMSADGRLRLRPNSAQRRYLLRGLSQPGGKLPLFDEQGQHVHPALVRACIAHGWAEPWFGNPLKPDWLVCKLTEKGRRAVANIEPLR
jgi:hypothetical protein